MRVVHSGIFEVDAMTDDLDAPATVGHNRPPDPSIERAGELVAAANLWLTTVEAIADADQAGRAQTFVDQLRANRTDLDAALKAERKPHDDAIGEIKKRFTTPQGLTGIALRKLLDLLAPWLGKEKQRLADEQAARKVEADRAAVEAERLRREAAGAPDPVEAELRAQQAAKAAADAAKLAAKKPDRPQIKSDTSPRAMSLRTSWHAEVVDERLALRAFVKNESFRADCLEIAKAMANALARSAKSESAAPAGFRFFKKETPT
jgi:hypothetical protein